MRFSFGCPHCRVPSAVVALGHQDPLLCTASVCWHGMNGGGPIFWVLLVNFLFDLVQGNKLQQAPLPRWAG
jgi:hypothetical protein